MSIAEKIQSDTKDAMRSRERERLKALRTLSAALKNSEIEAGRALSEEEEQTVLRRQLKQREEAADAYSKAGREERANSESAEADIVRSYLPAPLSREELEQVADRAISETGASSMKDMGTVMGRATALAENRAEGRELAAIVRSKLQ